jgi:GMP synthase (glutamine-hydrolysing)
VFENQAFSAGTSAFGIQFHSELTYAMACRWTVHGAARFALPMAQARPEHMAGWFRYDPPIRAWLWNFLDLWLARDQRGAIDQRAA